MSLYDKLWCKMSDGGGLRERCAALGVAGRIRERKIVTYLYLAHLVHFTHKLREKLNTNHNMLGHTALKNNNNNKHQ